MLGVNAIRPAPFPTRRVESGRLRSTVMRTPFCRSPVASKSSATGAMRTVADTVAVLFARLGFTTAVTATVGNPRPGSHPGTSDGSAAPLLIAEVMQKGTPAACLQDVGR